MRIAFFVQDRTDECLPVVDVDLEVLGSDFLVSSKDQSHDLFHDATERNCFENGGQRSVEHVNNPFSVVGVT